jgi:hypothetical protein
VRVRLISLCCVQDLVESAKEHAKQKTNSRLPLARQKERTATARNRLDSAVDVRATKAKSFLPAFKDPCRALSVSA